MIKCALGLEGMKECASRTLVDTRSTKPSIGVLNQTEAVTVTVAQRCHVIQAFIVLSPRCRTISLSFILDIANGLHSRPVNPRVVQVCIGFFQALKSIKARCIPQCSSMSFLFMRMMHSTVFSLAGFFHLAIFLSVVHVRIY